MKMKNLNIVQFIETRIKIFVFYFNLIIFINNTKKNKFYCRIADKILQENKKILGIKKSLFYFLFFFIIVIAISLANYKLSSTTQNADVEEYEEDEKMPEAIVLNSEPIENESL